MQKFGRNNLGLKILFAICTIVGIILFIFMLYKVSFNTALIIFVLFAFILYEIYGFIVCAFTCYVKDYGDYISIIFSSTDKISLYKQFDIIAEKKQNFILLNDGYTIRTIVYNKELLNYLEEINN